MIITKNDSFYSNHTEFMCKKALIVVIDQNIGVSRHYAKVASQKNDRGLFYARGQYADAQ